MKRVIMVLAAVVISTGPILFLSQTATAAQITNRSVTIGSAVPSAATSYVFGFKNATAGAIQALTFQACTTALGTCTTPTGFNIEGAGALTVGSFGGFAGTVTAPTQNTSAGSTPNYTNAVACNSANIYCETFTDATSQTAGTALTVTFPATVVNPSTTNTAYYVRINDWSTASFTSTAPVDSGTVAASTSQTFTVNATIQEFLNFCVGATNVAETYNSAVPACGSITGTSLNLGLLGTSYVAVSPESVAGSGGDGNEGVAELTTNAANGSTVSYYSIQNTSSGALKVAGATCAGGGSVTDQCINDSSAGTTITAGTEKWGMAIPGVNCNNVGAAYTCNATNHNLVVQSPYYCTAGDSTTSFATTDTGGQSITGTTACSYAWDDTGGVNTVATSAGSSSKVVGGEALLLEFAATPSITTPTGVYAASANFIATPTF